MKLEKYNRRKILSYSILLLFIFEIGINTVNISSNILDVNSQKVSFNDGNSNLPQPNAEIIYDNKTKPFIFLFNSTNPNFTEIQNNFNLFGGEIKEGPWNTVKGFAGRINNSQNELGNFSDEYPDVIILDDSIIEQQMNTVHQQLQMYPSIIDNQNFNITGSNNGSIAFLDSGIDDSHIFFENGYNELNYDNKIIGWKDFTEENSSNPIDDNGHGTSISAIAAGSANKSYESNHIDSNYYMTAGGKYSHSELFYPHHISPGIYTHKITSFKMDNQALNILNINGSLTTTGDYNNFQLELYKDGLLVNYSSPINDLMQISWNTSESSLLDNNTDLYDVYFSYENSLGASPTFNILLNISFTPEKYLKNYTNFAGISPKTKITSLKILNSSGYGFSSDLISALEWIISNREDYHIFATVLSVGNFDMEETLSIEISELIDRIISNGTMVIISAGNIGIAPKSNLLTRNQRALIVGSVNNEDQVAYYSDQGDDIFRPDVLAPGGSMLLNKEGVISADTNDKEPNGITNEQISNDLSFSVGTSISSSIVAGIYSNIVDIIGGWNYWKDNGIDNTLYVKNLLLMTATESNLEREDDPHTPYDESLNSPIINHGNSDEHEGYGRINPKAIYQMLNNSFSINSTTNFSLNASDSNAFGDHVYALNVTLEKEKVYKFELNNLESLISNFDADMYLFEERGDNMGHPIIIQSNNEIGNQDEYFYFSNPNMTKTYYLIIKAISGSGFLNLSVIEQNCTQSPVLNSARFEIESDYNYSDILDTYRIEINYTHSENFPASYIYLHLNTSIQPILMLKDENDGSNYTNGCLYYSIQHFNSPGQIKYNFTVQTGIFIYNFQDENNFIIQVNPIHNLASFGYQSNFEHWDNLWDFENEKKNITFQNENIAVSTGWNIISIENSLENRLTFSSENNWKSFYCGITKTDLINSSILIKDGDPLYSNVKIEDSFELTSPILYLNNSKLTNPKLFFGIRSSLGMNDIISFQIRKNRSEWIDLIEYSNSEFNWDDLSFNLSKYIGNFIQIRVLAQYSNQIEEHKGGFMIDFISFQENDVVNDNPPILTKFHDINYNPSVQPYYEPNNSSNLGVYTFQVAYIDEDGNLPEWVYLEIDGNFYPMNNRYGRWNSSIVLSVDYTNEIVYEYILPIFNLLNTSFRFHAFDGKYTTSSSWQFEIDIQEITPHPFPITTNIDKNQWTIIETFNQNSPTCWISSNTTWHQLWDFENTTDDSIWYCGIANNSGYGNNYHSNLISPLISLDGNNEIFLNFIHKLRFETDGEIGGDYAEVFISIDYGKNWIILEKINEETSGLNFEEKILDISKYIGKNALFRFKFSSDNTGTQIKNSGWIIKQIVIDINHTKDYINPSIQYDFDNLQPGDKVSGLLSIKIIIDDNQEIDTQRTEFWVNNELIPIEIINGTITYDFDTTDYSNGKILEIVCIVYDKEGNRAIEKIYFQIKNPINPHQLILLSTLFLLIASIVIIKIINERKIRYLLSSGDYIRKPNLLEKIKQNQFDKKKNQEDTEILLSLLDEKWEKNQPFIVFCKNCKKFFNTREFDIYCPSCNHDSLFITKFCPVCKKWRYFDEEGTHTKCKKCELRLLKDFDLAKKEILRKQNQENTINENFEKKKREIQTIAKNLPDEELKKILNELVEKSEDGL